MKGFTDLKKEYHLNVKILFASFKWPIILSIRCRMLKAL